MDRRTLLTAGGAIAGLAASAVATAAAAQTAQSGTPPTADVPPGSDAAARAPQAPQPVTPAGLPTEALHTDWPNLHRYHQANTEVMSLPAVQRRAVMMGDSITDNWAKPEYGAGFFEHNGLVGRGISGQVSAQMLVRFTPEVIALKPAVVHIMAGTNDIAENQDPYDFATTTGNLQAMITLAKANGIRVVMASVPPAISFSWRPYRGNQLGAIVALNTWIKAQCAAQNLVYCDYWPVLQGPDGGLRPDLGYHGDSVHPGPAGYAAMDPVCLAAIAQALKG